MVRVVGEAGFARYGALKTISFALTDSRENCEALVNAGGLKAIFPAFMGKGVPHTQQLHGADAARREEEYAVGVIATLLQNLPEYHPEATAGSAAHAPAPGKGLERLRVLAKFKEASGGGAVTGSGLGSSPLLDKVSRLVDLHTSLTSRVARMGDGRAPDSDDEDEDEEDADGDEDMDKSASAARRSLVLERRYLRRLDGGLYSLQRVDQILAALLTAKDADLAFAARAKLIEQGGSALQLIDVLSEYVEHLAPSVGSTPTHASSGPDGTGKGAGAGAGAGGRKGGEERAAIQRLLLALAEGSGIEAEAAEGGA
jgi:beta-catenin-like protein 1